MKRAMTVAFVAMMYAGVLWADKPNVVIIYGDDVGYGDVGFGGSKMIPTPNIDKLARGGLIFTDGHCSSSVCSPSRFAMLTGTHPLRGGLSVIAPGGPLAIKPDAFTLPDLFKKAGYSTAVIGKWHLGLGPGGGRVGNADWNGKIKPGVSDALVGQIDFLASFAALLDVDIPKGQAKDSRNLLPVFMGESDKGVDYLLQGFKAQKALRYRNWKYLPPRRKTKQPEQLYNLELDIGEQNNLIEQNPEMTQHMRDMLKKILAADAIRDFE